MSKFEDLSLDEQLSILTEVKKKTQKNFEGLIHKEEDKEAEKLLEEI